MSEPLTPPPKDLSSHPAPSPQQTLRRLYLTLFLRGHSARGLNKEKVPGSIGQKLAFQLILYALIGLVAVSFVRLPIFALATYLHAMTFTFLGMFLASTVGEVLFNKDESDILLHRPISPRILLWAKIRVLLEASLWMAGVFNLAGFVVGFSIADGGWRFALAHLVSVAMEAVFCAGCVVMVYQLCLRWFGRERLDGLITTAQVIVSVAVVVGSQVLPQLVMREGATVTLDKLSSWIVLLPPAWFAGFDDAISGQTGWKSWTLAALAIVATVLVVWIAFDRLARDYQSGLQKLSETVSRKSGTKVGRRWIDIATGYPPLCWWLRDPVTRASFLLSVAYLVRDRDVKLRMYPSLAPMMAIPIMFLFQEHSRSPKEFTGFGTAFASSYLCLVPMTGLSIFQFSQQWQASDIFRTAPLAGPAKVCDGARKAILLLLALPALIFFGAAIWIVQRDVTQLLLLLPGAIALPVFSYIPVLRGHCVPLSQPVDEAKGVSRALPMFAAMMISFLLSGIATWSWSTGWFHWLMLAEIIALTTLYLVFRRISRNALWPSLK